MRRKILIITGTIIVIVFVLFKFVISFYRMPDQTMEDTIKKGDLLVINKLAGGDFFMGLKTPAFSNFKTGDVVYFLDPSDVDAPLYDRKRIVARIISCPGDNYQMTLRDAFVNDVLYEGPSTIKHSYRIVAKEGVKLDSSFFLKYGLSEWIKEGDKTPMHYKYKNIYHLTDEKPLDIFDVPMSKEQSIDIEKDSAISYVRMVKTKTPARVIRVWPFSPYWFWNRWDTKQPFQIPAKGQYISVTYRTLGVYEDIIEKYEDNVIEANLQNQIFINSQRVNGYTVKEDYYLVLSDNRDRFYDTRTWGLVPKKYIIGKVVGK